MSWPIPEYSRSKVDEAGTILANAPPAYEPQAIEVDLLNLAWAERVLSNWRACHGYPMNTFQATLRNKLKRIDPEAIVAQRLKRAPTIIDKLQRHSRMKLSTMQDIGGLRAIVGTMAHVDQLRHAYANSRHRHVLKREDDYIARPKTDGYRSLHFIYRYCNSRAEAYNGLSIELQIRTKLQHSWATAVETASTFLDKSLKQRRGGEDPDWMRFFAIASSAFAHIENVARVPGYEDYSWPQTADALARAESVIGALAKLRAYSDAVNVVSVMSNGGAAIAYYLIMLNTDTKVVTVLPLPRTHTELAMREYENAEARAARGEPIASVLVSTGSLLTLQRAYPNFFLDTREFVGRVSEIVQATR